MADTVIHVENIWKQYRLGVINHGTLRADLASWWARMRGREDPNLSFDDPRLAKAIDGEHQPDRFWALKDINFEVKQGEVLGIIGKNGAGKSTLLKILSRVTTPTRGQIKVKGRIASLLEVGTGFHPDLTGRENIFLNGAILGMSKGEIRRKLDEIIAFAEVEKFIDTPVKRYSSGMYVRLAFAVAAHLEPEILVVDEVLAVGDAEFQKKCLGKMGDVASQGRTVLFVSHNMQAIQSLCSNVVWLDGGSIKGIEAPAKAVADYLRSASTMSGQRYWPDIDTAPGNEQIRIRRYAVHPKGNPDGTRIDVDSGVEVVFEYWNQVEGAKLNLSLHIYSDTGVLVLNAVPLGNEEWFGKPYPQGLFRETCVLPGRLLNAGGYRVELLVVRDQGHIIFCDANAITFEVADVHEPRSSWHGGWPGVVRPSLEWKINRLEGELA